MRVGWGRGACLAASLVGALLCGAAQASGYKVLYTFSPYGPGPGSPGSGPVFDAQGNLIGSSEGGGEDYSGTLYRITKSGRLSVLYSFLPRSFPQASPTLDSQGDIFLPSFEGPYDIGAYLHVSGPGGGSMNFVTGLIGAQSPLIFNPQGDLEGTTNGSVFTISLKTKTTTILRYFPDGSPTSANYILPGRLAIDAAGNVYGGTLAGGTHNQGTLFRISPSGAETILYNFPDPFGCAAPNSGLVFDSAGNLYGGTTNDGVFFSLGTCAFKLSPSGQYTLLHQFNPTTEGGSTNGEFVFDAKGNIYGTNASGGPLGGGTLFRLAPDGKVTVLYAFARQSNNTGIYGYQPNYGLAVDAAGNLYGTTASGGNYDNSGTGAGVLFEYSP